ncbi:MAG: aminoacyl-tRNA hydrolase [Myxococcota bacterium]
MNFLSRHNIGFVVVDRLAERAGTACRDKKFKARLGRGRLGQEDVVFLQPQTFMNLSGESVGPALGFYKLGTDRLVVVHDELELDFGEVKTKLGGGHGGHNGLRSLKKHLPDDRFSRVRVGIGRPPPRWDPADYVLSRFDASERGQLDDVVDRAVVAVETLIEQGPQPAPKQAAARGR